MPRQTTGKSLAREWGVAAGHAHFSQNGRWFHPLKFFPGALFDREGYVLFETEEGYKSALGSQIKKDVNVVGGISSLPAYVRVVRDGIVVIPRATERATYESERARRQIYREGAAIEMTLTRYERDSAARDACLNHHGFRCAVCGLLFSEKYGEIGEKFIHVHHVNPLAEAGTERELNPVTDLIPVCPNCHAMIHRRNPPLTVSQVRELIAP
jgi:hypothetical protein